jgi:hypothetical protein
VGERVAEQNICQVGEFFGQFRQCCDAQAISQVDSQEFAPFESGKARSSIGVCRCQLKPRKFLGKPFGRFNVRQISISLSFKPRNVFRVF